ncbi:helix-turn-helix domain-containing protein [Plantibacter flavus]|nr:helix-turn-helix domain-containing protein [Plantibacter flavus]
MEEQSEASVAMAMSELGHAAIRDAYRAVFRAEQTVERVMQDAVLACAQQSMVAGDISRRLQLPRSTVRRILRTSEAERHHHQAVEGPAAAIWSALGVPTVFETRSNRRSRSQRLTARRERRSRVQGMRAALPEMWGAKATISFETEQGEIAAVRVFWVSPQLDDAEALDDAIRSFELGYVGLGWESTLDMANRCVTFRRPQVGPSLAPNATA